MSKEDLGSINIQVDIDGDWNITKRDISIKNVSSIAFLAVMFDTIIDVVVDQNIDIEVVEKTFRLALDSIVEKQIQRLKALHSNLTLC